MMNPTLLIVLYALGGCVMELCAGLVERLVLLLEYGDTALVDEVYCEVWDKREQDADWFAGECRRGNVSAIAAVAARYALWPITIPVLYYHDYQVISAKIDLME